MINRFKRYIQNPRESLENRLFALLAAASLIGLVVAFIGELAVGENWFGMATTVGSFLAFCFFVFYGFHYHKMNVARFMVSFFLVTLYFPLAFFTSGGDYGGIPIWFTFATVFLSMSNSGKMRIFFLAEEAVMVLLCWILSWLHPNWLLPHSKKTSSLDTLVTLFIVSATLAVIVIFQMRMYEMEKIRAEERKKEIEELSRAQNRFFSSMSHEIRTPINTIIGLNEMILRDEAVSDEIASDAKNIQGAGKMLLAIINDILDMSKMESGKMDIVPVAYDTGGMLSEIVNMIWAKTNEKGLQFHVDVDTELPVQLYGDEVRIKQVLVNLLNNAVKYTDEGYISLSIESVPVDGNRVKVIYTVSDTGMGIRKESIPYLFDAFKRVDEEKNRHIEGTGLGLSIVKQIVDLMNGEISVNSIYTQGSTFIVSIEQPVMDEAVVGELNFDVRHSLSEREHYKAAFTAPEARILIVDDNEVNLMVEKKLIRDTKVITDVALSGAECLEHTLQMHYDLIFMDHLMPEMDGIECLEAIRTQVGGFNRETPVVILTANAGSENQALYRQAGFDSYLLKPVSGIQLEGMMLKFLPKEKLTLTENETGFSNDADIIRQHRQKAMVVITTDSVCDLPEDLIGKMGIQVLPYHVYTKDGMFYDNVEMDADEILFYMENESGEIHTGGPTVEDYEAFFAFALEKARHVIHISMTQKMSRGFLNATEAARVFGNVSVVDSGQFSSGMGIVALEAAQMAREELETEEIVKRLSDVIKRVNTSFVVDTPYYLARSGRISRRMAAFWSAFPVHPVIGLKNGSMRAEGMVIAAVEGSHLKYMRKVLRSRNIDPARLFITYSGLSFEELTKIRQDAAGLGIFDEIICRKASSVISINCGPKSFGLFFMTKQTAGDGDPL